MINTLALASGLLSWSRGAVAQYLIHVHSAPDLVNKATVALLVARTAVAEGHAVELFLAADGTHLLNCKAAGEVVGQAPVICSSI